MPLRRVNFPETLPGATKFSGYASLNDPVQLLRAFKEASWISRPLINKVNAMEAGCGRPRMAGSWVLVAVAFMASRQGDIQPFHDRASLELWRTCGFERRPCYSTTHARLTELEDALPEIEDAIERMVRHFIRIEPRIGRHIHIDGTEAETQSRFFHDCQDDDDCAWRREGETAADVNKRVLGKTTTETAQRRRHQEDAGEVEDEAEEMPLGEPTSIDNPQPYTNDATAPPRHASRKRPLYRVQTSRHIWSTHDPDAGFRSYRKPNGTVEGWHGYYHSRAIDDFTGLTLCGLVTSSSRTEHSQYDEILRGIIRSINPPSKRPDLDNDLTLTKALVGKDVRLPEAIIGDRGFAYPFIYEQNTRLGILTVTPWRKFADGRDQPTDITLVGRDGLPFVVDRHGVIHCKHCSGPTKQVELRRAKNENPRIYVECLLPSAPDSPCQKLQSVSCDLDWRMLTPLPRNDERYIALDQRFQFERAHHMGRVRNRNGAKDSILRPKRLGLKWQQLLLSLGTMIDWFRAGLKHGWLASTRSRWSGYSKHVRDKIREKRQRLEEQVEKTAQKLHAERQAAGLDHCCRPPKPEPPPP
jgi:hypothetical protein